MPLLELAALELVYIVLLALLLRGQRPLGVKLYTLVIVVLTSTLLYISYATLRVDLDGIVHLIEDFRRRVYTCLNIATDVYFTYSMILTFLNIVGLVLLGFGSPLTALSYVATSSLHGPWVDYATLALNLSSKVLQALLLLSNALLEILHIVEYVPLLIAIGSILSIPSRLRALGLAVHTLNIALLTFLVVIAGHVDKLEVITSSISSLNSTFLSKLALTLRELKLVSRNVTIFNVCSSTTMLVRVMVHSDRGEPSSLLLPKDGGCTTYVLPMDIRNVSRVSVYAFRLRLPTSYSISCRVTNGVRVCNMTVRVEDYRSIKDPSGKLVGFWRLLYVKGDGNLKHVHVDSRHAVLVLELPPAEVYQEGNETFIRLRKVEVKLLFHYVPVRRLSSNSKHSCSIRVREVGDVEDIESLLLKLQNYYKLIVDYYLRTGTYKKMTIHNVSLESLGHYSTYEVTIICYNSALRSQQYHIELEFNHSEATTMILPSIVTERGINVYLPYSDNLYELYYRLHNIATLCENLQLTKNIVRSESSLITCMYAALLSAIGASLSIPTLLKVLNVERLATPVASFLRSVLYDMSLIYAIAWSLSSPRYTRRIGKLTRQLVARRFSHGKLGNVMTSISSRIRQSCMKLPSRRPLAAVRDATQWVKRVERAWLTCVYHAERGCLATGVLRVTRPRKLQFLDRNFVVRILRNVLSSDWDREELLRQVQKNRDLYLLLRDLITNLRDYEKFYRDYSNGKWSKLLKYLVELSYTPPKFRIRNLLDLSLAVKLAPLELIVLAFDRDYMKEYIQILKTTRDVALSPTFINQIERILREGPRIERYVKFTLDLYTSSYLLWKDVKRHVDTETLLTLVNTPMYRIRHMPENVLRARNVLYRSLPVFQVRKFIEEYVRFLVKKCGGEADPRVNVEMRKAHLIAELTFKV